MQQGLEGLEQSRYTTRGHQPLGQVFAGGLDVGYQRYAPGNLVEALQGQRYADAAGERQQVNDDVGRSTHRAQ
ncbi:hypothetical protein D3C78_1732280 [compost metagenome]